MKEYRISYDYTENDETKHGCEKIQATSITEAMNEFAHNNGHLDFIGLTIIPF